MKKNTINQMEYWSRECVVLVVVEMTVAVIGIVLNLLVVTSVRNQERLQVSTTNLLLANITFSNLMVAFLVKPISAIYLSYALSIGKWQVGLAFCSLYSLTYHTTWLVVPLSLLAMCWIGILSIIKKSKRCINSSPPSIILEEIGGKIVETKKIQIFPTARQKALLVMIWTMSAVYGLMASFPDKVLGEDIIRPSSAPLQEFQQDMPDDYMPESSTETDVLRNSDLTYCTILTVEGNTLDNIQVYLSLYLPGGLGPVLAFILLVVLSPCLCASICRSEEEGCCCSSLLLPVLCVIYLLSYSLHLIISDKLDLDEFTLLLVKYGVGFFHLTLIPVAILLFRKDFRAGVRETMNGRVVCAAKPANQPNYHAV